MLLQLLLFLFWVSLFISLLRPNWLRQVLRVLVLLFSALQLLVMIRKGQFAAYMDLEELYLGLMRGDYQLLMLDKLQWSYLLAGGLLSGLILFIAPALIARFYNRKVTQGSLASSVAGFVTKQPLTSKLVIIAGLCVLSLVSSTSLYRNSFVIVRTLAENIRLPHYGVEMSAYQLQSVGQNQVLLSQLQSSQLDSFSFIAHASGGLISSAPTQEKVTLVLGSYSNKDVGLRYSNSIQALEQTIVDGKRLIEVDLISTTDGVLIGGHDWPRVKGLIGYKGITDRKLHDKSPLSFAEFNSLRAKSVIQPLDMVQLNGLFEQHPELVLVTDKTKEYGKLAEHFTFPQRAIVECFNLYQCLQAQSFGFSHVALNVNLNNPELVPYLLRNNIKLVTYRGPQPEQSLAYSTATALIDSGVIGLAYTSKDDLDYIRGNIGKTASAIYTDYYSLQTKKLAYKPD